jgi:hypothetical protein
MDFPHASLPQPPNWVEISDSRVGLPSSTVPFAVLAPDLCISHAPASWFVIDKTRMGYHQIYQSSSTCYLYVLTHRLATKHSEKDIPTKMVEKEESMAKKKADLFPRLIKGTLISKAIKNNVNMCLLHDECYSNWN